MNNVRLLTRAVPCGAPSFPPYERRRQPSRVLSGKSADLANYFLDTSALAKRYHKENGSEHMDRILEEPPGSRSLISDLSIVDLESVAGASRHLNQSARIGAAE